MSSVFAARDDRDLRFTQEWDGQCLAFDRRTSDLFVVPEVGRRLLNALRQGGPMDARMLLDEMASGDPATDRDSVEVIERVLSEFESCGLIEPFCVDCCGPDSP